MRIKEATAAEAWPPYTSGKLCMADSRFRIPDSRLPIAYPAHHDSHRVLSAFHLLPIAFYLAIVARRGTRKALTNDCPLPLRFRLNQPQMTVGAVVDHVDAFGVGVAEHDGAGARAVERVDGFFDGHGF